MKINREDRDWYYTQIGNLVKFARESQRLTQRALANKAGVQLNTVRGIEEGRRFNADNAVWIYEILGVNIITIKVNTTISAQQQQQNKTKVVNNDSKKEEDQFGGLI